MGHEDVKKGSQFQSGRLGQGGEKKKKKKRRLFTYTGISNSILSVLIAVRQTCSIHVFKPLIKSATHIHVLYDKLFFFLSFFW